MTPGVTQAAGSLPDLDHWVCRVNALAEQIAEWSAAEGWTVERDSVTLREKLGGEYQVPRLLVMLPEGELHVQPAAYMAAGEGRVDLEGYPTFSRVKLMSGPEWRIITDSNVPLRLPWNRQTYAQLARDLLS